jgi:hypothetical protein
MELLHSIQVETSGKEMLLMDTWFAVAAILVGLAGCFYGYPLFRIFLILAGLIYGYLLGESLAPAGHPWLALVVSLGTAVILAMLAYPLWSIGVIVIGAVLGFMAFSSLGMALNTSQAVLGLLGVLGVMIGAFLSYGARDLFVMLATSFNGAVQLVYGLGLFFPTLVFGGGRSNFLAVLAIVVLGGFGFVTQYAMFKNRWTYSD